MRVLHLISSGGMYGAEAVILNLCLEMNAGAQHAGTVCVFAHQEKQAPALYQAARQLDLPSEMLPCKGQIDTSVPRKIRGAVERFGADVLHAHGYKADIYAYLALRSAHRPALVSTCHTWYDNDAAVRVYGAADRWVLRSFDQVIAVSDEVRDRLVRAGVRAERVHLIRNGIRLAPFQMAPETRRQRAGSAVPLRVGLVGRLAPEKGVDVFLQAIAGLVRAHPEAQFVVAGDGPDRAALDALAKELGIENHVQLIGTQSNMPEFFASLDLLVSASRQEGLPMALLEGMASGLPVIATSVGAVPEVVLEKKTGLLVPPGDAAALGQAMERLMGDAKLRASFGAAGQRRIKEEFSAERMTADYLAVYADALAGRGAPSSAPQQSGALG